MPSESATERLAELRGLFGPPWERTNPLGFDAVLAADERAEMFADGERALDEFGLNREFVPVAEGGRLGRLDDLIEVMREVYRRDPNLGLGYGASSLIAGVNVWTAASAEQRGRVAKLLLANRKVACAYHELDHGNDMAGTEFAATPGAGGLRLTGRKEVVTNIQRADALVMLARTESGRGARTHSQLLVDKTDLPEARFGYLPRFATVGMRGVQLGGMWFDDCPLSSDAVLGERGHGLETAIRSFQITRLGLPAMATGILDTTLRATLRHARSRSLSGRAVADIPLVRAVLAGAFADLLLCEVFSGVAARALHLLPGEGGLLAPAVKYGVSKPLLSAVSRLGGVLGAQSYLRSHVVEKLLRDIKPVAFAHIARAACLSTVLPQLPIAARRSWRAGEAAPGELFDLNGDLAPLDFGRLVVSSAGQDHIAPSIAQPLSTSDESVRELVAHFAAELAELAEVSSALRPVDLTLRADADSHALADRYVRVLAAAACVGAWRHAADGFLADPAWLVAVLTRLRARTERDAMDLPPGVADRLLHELLDRDDHGVGFGVAAEPTA